MIQKPPPPTDKRNPPRSPELPPDDNMPPYSPGGVPEPEGSGHPEERPDKGESPSPTLPPKRAP